MRFDEYLFNRGFFDSRTKAKQAIVNGKVLSNCKQINKPATEIDETQEYDITIEAEESFVSLGGYKLSKALKDFGFSVQGKTVADIGASTGGFTDCLLQNGAEKVYAVDLNDDLLHSSLKSNGKVIRIIKNAKDLKREDFKYLEIITADLSFISAKQVLQVFYDLLPESGKVILLIKPQFEMGKRQNFKNGIIKDGKILKNACREVYDAATKTGFCALNMTTAPAQKNKNTEFLILLLKSETESISFDDLFNFKI